ncbi:Hemin-binding lipoprotein [uncultured Clostridium sp.]|nr:Hemin-binding lipoprotein [uncultured Clostridium sp.]
MLNALKTLMSNIRSYISSKRPWRAMAAMMIALSLTAGCVAVDESAQVIQAPTPTPSAVQPIAGGTLKLGMDQNITTLHPLKTKNRSVMNALSLVFEGLVRLDDTGKPIAALAEKWELQEGEDGSLAWVFTLRQGVSFHQGGELKAADVVYSFNTIKALGEGSYWSAGLSGATACEAIDEYTVKIHVQTPSYGIIGGMNFPVIPQSYYEQRESDPLCLPNGTGAYVCQSYAQQEGMKLAANESWWRPRAKFDAVEVLPYATQEDMHKAFELGQLDCIDTDSVLTGQYQSASVRAGAKEYTAHTLDALIFNYQNTLAQNEAFRAGIAYAIDAKNIANTTYQNHALITEGLIPQDSWLYSNQHKAFEHSKEVALAQFQAAGLSYDTQTQTLRQGGLPVSLTLLVCDDISNPYMRYAAETLQDQLAQVGITVVLDRQGADGYDKKLKEHTYDLAMVRYTVGTTMDWSFAFDTESPNYCGYRSATISQSLEDIAQQRDEKGYKQAVSQLEQCFVYEVPFISLFYRTNTLLTQEKLYTNDTAPLDLNSYHGMDKWMRTP